MYGIFMLPKERKDELKKIYQDDLVSRQTLVERDGEPLGLAPGYVYLLVEGSGEAVERARELLKGVAEMLTGEKAEEARKKFAAQDESVVEGMGAIFG